MHHDSIPCCCTGSTECLYLASFESTCVRLIPNVRTAAAVRTRTACCLWALLGASEITTPPDAVCVPFCIKSRSRITWYVFVYVPGYCSDIVAILLLFIICSHTKQYQVLLLCELVLLLVCSCCCRTRIIRSCCISIVQLVTAVLVFPGNCTREALLWKLIEISRGTCSQFVSMVRGQRGNPWGNFQ